MPTDLRDALPLFLPLLEGATDETDGDRLTHLAEVDLLGDLDQGGTYHFG